MWSALLTCGWFQLTCGCFLLTCGRFWSFLFFLINIWSFTINVWSLTLWLPLTCGRWINMWSTINMWSINMWSRGMAFTNFGPVGPISLRAAAGSQNPKCYRFWEPLNRGNPKAKRNVQRVGMNQPHVNRADHMLIETRSID